MGGKLIVLYGANNLGKSTQVELLEKYLTNHQISVKRIKYPIYDLEPTGPLINEVLRKGKKLPEEEFQRTYVQNRRDFEPTLKSILDSGTWVIAEDYIGTGIAWGMVRGVALKVLEKMNTGLYPADLSIVLYGKQFESGKELDHKNETDSNIWETAQNNHLLLAKKYKWKKVKANQSVEKVNQNITKIIKQYFF